MSAGSLDAAILACLQEALTRKATPIVESREGRLHFGPFGRNLQMACLTMDKFVLKLRIPNEQGWDICMEGMEDPAFFDDLAWKLIDYCKRVLPGSLKWTV